MKAESADKMITGIPYYNILYNQKYRNEFEWNQHLNLKKQMNNESSMESVADKSGDNLV